jgi:hypothetical protein
MNNKKYHSVGTVPTLNRTEANLTPLALVFAVKDILKLRMCNIFVCIVVAYP